jgi:hypothetical protein
MVLKADLTNSYNTPLRSPEDRLEFLYIALFAVLAVNGLVVLIALSHAMNNRD